MANGYTLVQALQAAGKNLTRQGLINAVNSSGASWKGPGIVPYRYSSSDHGGFAGVKMAKVQGGKVVEFGSALTTDPTASGPITPYTGTQAPPPASGVPTQ
jgi:hypothetical protein